MVQQIWSKLNMRERQAAMGAGLIVLSWLLGIVLCSGLYGIAGAGGVGLLGAIAVLVVVYLLELYPQEWLVADDPAWPTYTQYHRAYAQALARAASEVGGQAGSSNAPMTPGPSGG